MASLQNQRGRNKKAQCRNFEAAGAYRCVIKPEPLHAEANIALEQGLYSRPGPFDTAYGTIA